MAREYGKIIPRYWTGGSGAKLRSDPNARLVGAYVFTAPTAHPIGIYYLPIVTAAHELGLLVEEVRRCLGRLAEPGIDVAYYDEAESLIWVPEMGRVCIGETMKGKDLRRGWLLREAEAFKKHRFFALFVERYRGPWSLPWEAPSKPLPVPIEAPSGPHQRGGSRLRDGDGDGAIDVCRAPVREKQEECQDERGHGDDCSVDYEKGERIADGTTDGQSARSEGGTHGARQGQHDGEHERDRRETGTGGSGDVGVVDTECLLPVLARMVSDGDPWAQKVERWRQENPSRALTENQRKVLRRKRDEAAAPSAGRARRALTAQDEADATAMVEAYVQGHRRIIRDRGYVALSTHKADALKILPDARTLAERARRGEWKPTPAEVVAHKCVAYMRNPKWGPEFALRFLFDRTEQDDLPRPKAALPEARAAPPKLDKVLPTKEERDEIQKRIEDIRRIGLGPTPKRKT